MTIFTNETLAGEIDGKNSLFELKTVPVGNLLQLFVQEPEQIGFTLRLPNEYYMQRGEFVIIRPAPKPGTRIVATYAAE